MPIVIYEIFNITTGDIDNYCTSVLRKIRAACREKNGIPVVGPHKVNELWNWQLVQVECDTGETIVLAICSDSLYLYGWRIGDIHSTRPWNIRHAVPLDLMGSYTSLPFDGRYDTVGNPDTLEINRRTLLASLRALFVCNPTHPSPEVKTAFSTMIVTFCVTIRMKVARRSVRRDLRLPPIGACLVIGDKQRELNWDKGSKAYIQDRNETVEGYGTINHACMDRYISVLLWSSQANYKLPPGRGWQEVKLPKKEDVSDPVNDDRKHSNKNKRGNDKRQLSRRRANRQGGYAGALKGLAGPLHGLANKVAAGEQLYSIVANLENTEKMLVQNVELRRRETITPLNKIQANLVPQRIQQRAAQMLGGLVKKLEQELEAAKQDIKEKQTHYDNCDPFLKKLEKLIKDHGNQREARLKDLDNCIMSIKIKMQLVSKKLKEHESQRGNLIMEKDAVFNDLSTLEEELAISKYQIKSLSDTLENHKSKVPSKEQTGALTSKLPSCCGVPDDVIKSIDALRITAHLMTQFATEVMALQVGSALSDPSLAFAAALKGLPRPLHGLANKEVLLWIKSVVEECGENVRKEQLKDYVWKTLNSVKVGTV